MQTQHLELPDQLVSKLDRMAHELDRSPSWIVRQALESWLSVQDVKTQQTLEALADVDAGRIVDHSQVCAWVDSWDSDKELPRPGITQ